MAGALIERIIGRPVSCFCFLTPVPQILKFCTFCEVPLYVLLRVIIKLVL